MATREQDEVELDDAPRPDVGSAATGYVRWALTGWGCFLAFFAYLYVVVELLPEPGVRRTLAHVVGITLVVLGSYGAYRSWRSGRVLESESARGAREELARLRRAPSPATDRVVVVKLPLVVEARPKAVDDRAKNPAAFLVAAVLIGFLAWDISDGRGWAFLPTFAGSVVALAAIIGLVYAARSRGRITVDEGRVTVRRVLRTRRVKRSALVDAVQIVMVLDSPRGPDGVISSVHVTREGGRNAFSMHDHVYDEAGVAAVLSALRLPLRRVAGMHDPVGVEAFVPGSTSLAQRRPFTFAFAVVGGLIAAVVVGILGAFAWVELAEWADDRGGSGRDSSRASASSVYVAQTLTVDGVSGSLYGRASGLAQPESRMLLFGSDALEAQPDTGCRLRSVADVASSCSAWVTPGFARRARELSASSGNVLLSRSSARTTHDVTVLAVRREGEAHVLALSVVDDGGTPYGLDVVFLDEAASEGVFHPVVDDVRCAGRPDTSVHVATRFTTCG